MFLCFCQLALAPFLGPYPQLPSFAAYGVPLADLITGQCTSLVMGPVTQKWAGVATRNTTAPPLSERSRNRSDDPKGAK